MEFSFSVILRTPRREVFLAVNRSRDVSPKYLSLAIDQRCPRSRPTKRHIALYGSEKSLILTILSERKAYTPYATQNQITRHIGCEYSFSLSREGGPSVRHLPHDPFRALVIAQSLKRRMPN
jgi:hypothetical protein